MSNKNSLHEVKEISYYQNKVLSMMNFSGSKKKGFFYTWLNTFEYAADIFEVPDDKMKELFLTMVHEDFHAQIQLCFPYVNFSKISYEQIIEYYFHYFKSPNEDPHRRRFLYRNQYEQESIENYANSLRKICNKYNFQQPVEKKLCKKFINGICDEEIRTHLKKLPCLSFGEIVQFASDVKNSKEIITYLTAALSMINIYHAEKKRKFYCWVNKFEYVVDKIKVPRDKIIKFFNKMVDNDVHTSVKETYPSIDFSKLSYQEIINRYLRFFALSYVNNVHRNRFICRKQYEQESIESYADNLRKIYNKCSDKNQLKKKLCDLFIYGIRDDDVKNHLCNTRSLSFDKTVVKAIEFVDVKEITYYIHRALSMIHIYNPKREEGIFYGWLNEFEYVAEFIGVPNMKIIQFFYKMVNNDIHTNVRKAFPSVNFSELTYEEIINHYLLYFSPSYKSDLHRSRLLCRNQYEKETIEKYAYNLRKIYNKCNDRNRLEKELCEQFIKGIYDDDIRNHLSKILSLSFDEMVVEAVQFEKGYLIPYYINRALSMIRTYNPEKEGDFCSWLNKFEYVADFVRVPNKKMVKFFYKMVDYDVHLNVKEAFPFIDFFELSYKEVINNYFFYFTLSTEICLYRSRFVCREQYEKETIKKFADSLWTIYKKCNYSVPKYKKLCEVFVNGILDEKIKIHLKKNPKLSFDEMVAKAIGFENANEINYYLNPDISMIHIYNPTEEGMFHLWLNKFEYVVDIVGVPNYLMAELFCNMVDNDVHKNVKMTFPSVNFFKLSYDKIIDHYLHYFAPNDEMYLHRKRFYCRYQYEQETIENYAGNLQKIYNKCNYSCLTDKGLCDQFIRGISDDDIRNHLNKIHGLSFYETVVEAIAVAKEINFSQNKRKILN